MQRLTHLSQQMPSKRSLDRRCLLLQRAIARVQRDHQASSEICAELQFFLADILREYAAAFDQKCDAAIYSYKAALEIYTLPYYPRRFAAIHYNLGTVYQGRRLGDRSENLEEALACYRQILQVYTEGDFPVEWASTQNNLSVAYYERIAGERRFNLEEAIACATAALRVYQRETFPPDWAWTFINLGNAYSDRLLGERSANLEQALAYYTSALEVYTYSDFPTDWTMLQHNLGNIYRERIDGDHRANLEQAIFHQQETLRIYRREDFPFEWSGVQNGLGNAFLERVEGERRANLEQAIACYEATLQVYTYKDFPVEWAMTQHNLGNAWLFRVIGESSENLERALACYHKALQVYTYASSAEDWARTTHALGNAYRSRVLEDRRENLEQALACYTDISRVYTRSAFPLEWARLHEDKGHAYLYRIAGERKENLERTIDCYQAAFQVYTRENLPEDWARTQQNLGIAYRKRLAGQEHMNLQLAADCFQAALEVYTLEAFPDQHRRTQLNFVPVAATKGHWNAVERACARALAAEDLLVRLGSGAAGRDVILKEGRNTSLQYAFALMRQGKTEHALLALERGRTRGLAEALMLDTTDPEQIRDAAMRSRFHETRQRFIEAQSALNWPFSPTLTEQERRQLLLGRTVAYHQALTAFDDVVAEIRIAQHLPDFLTDKLDTRTILDIALIYLAATPWGGMALTALVPSPGEQTAEPYCAALELPALSEAALDDLLEVILDDRNSIIIGGFLHAQEHHGLDLLLQQWQEKTFRELATRLHSACEAANQASTLDTAAQTLLASPVLADLVDCPFEQVAAAQMEKLASPLEHTFLQLELQRCLTRLSESAMQPLIRWLRWSGSQRLTLVACGPLAAFPLAAVPLTDGQTVGETIPTCIALSARSLLPSQREASPRTGVYALGDPRPTHQPLRWGEAEAYTVAKLARILGWQGEAKVQCQARRSWAIRALQHGLIVDTSCHGTFNSDDFLQSALLLADGQRLTLATMLNREVDMHGLRLLILSACQTATLDVRGASNEVRSLTAGMIQAGVRAVLASLWSVDDRATYLLVVRFAQEWFPRMNEELPTAGLVRAQHWLRNVTNNELQQWQTTILPHITREERHMAGAQDLEYGHDREKLPVATSPLAVVRGRGTRYELQEAEALLHSAVKAGSPDAPPYEHPIYWAGFQITGW
jgi:CHAT domain-containing protein/tetratricopeptide (TPR) repeat protein